MITTTTKSHYGTDHIYIDDQRTAELVQQLTGKKTVTHADVLTLRQLGLEVKLPTD